MSYNWPGNIRELENLIERAVILDTDGVIGKDDLPEIILNRYGGVKNARGAAINVQASLKDALQEPEKVYILQVLKETGGNKKKAAVKLGVNRTTLYSKLRKYNLLSLASK
jgi:transcriptional regulator with PAS, ATPase and Fis domain